MQEPYNRMLEDISRDYGMHKFPVLWSQFREWSQSRPFAGKRLLDATPVFRNTCMKYAALLAGGAELHVAQPGIMPYDAGVLARLSEYGIPVVDPATVHEPYDVVLDCAGYLHSVPSRHGYVELTKSGLIRYQEAKAPVWMVDNSVIKRIETSLGTGESFFRAMEKLGHTNWRRGILLVIGYGKVGRGIVLYALQKGIRVAVADVSAVNLPESVDFVSVTDWKQFNNALKGAYCAVTSTGVGFAMESLIDAESVSRSPVLLANMGVEDEWGHGISKDRVLNDKLPLNFILDDPTLMCFIDPPMALHNAGAFELMSTSFLNGIHSLSARLENHYLELIKSAGTIPACLMNELTDA